MPKVQRNCLYCNASFERWPSNGGMYCSRPCFYAANPSTFDMAAWQERNRSDQNAKKAAWGKTNHKKKLAIQKKWREANKDKVAQSAKLRREIYKTGATRAEVLAIIEVAQGYCTYCDQPVEKLELDHVDPVAWGANHSIDNLLPACRSCNASKSDKAVEEWVFERFGIDGLARTLAMLESRERWAA